MKYLIWLRETAHMPADKCMRLLGHYGSGEAVFRADPASAARACGLNADEQKELSNKSLARAEHILGECKKANVRVMTIFDDDYPQRLKNIFDPPPVLYLRGKLPDFNRLPAIAIVGKREATPYGLAAAEKLGYHLSKAGFIIVSGIAIGVDSAAHTGAIKAGMPSVAVLGTAIDNVRPLESVPLSRRVLQSGAIISEYPPGARYRPWFYPMRNRIISGLSLGTVVAEAGSVSGSLNISEHAIEQGRDVFAVPGPINAASSAGANELIKNGAKLISGAHDIISEYAPLYGLSEAPAPRIAHGGAERRSKTPQNLRAAFSAPEKPAFVPTGDPVLDALGGETLHIDDLSEKLEMPQQHLLACLTVLEVEGKVRQLPGKRFERI